MTLLNIILKIENVSDIENFLLQFKNIPNIEYNKEIHKMIIE